MASRDHDDVSAVDELLKGIHGDTELIRTDESTGKDTGNITAVALRILQLAHHFFRWNSGTLRTSEEASKLVSPGSFRKNIREAPPELLAKEIFKLIRYSLSVSIRNSSFKTIGLNIALETVWYALTSDYMDEFGATLNWTVLNRADNSIALNIGPVEIGTLNNADEEGNSSNPKYYLLEGLMAATTAYPDIAYRTGLADVPLIPRYDSEMAIVTQSEYGGKYRILVDGRGFTGHYLTQIHSENRRRNSRGEPKVATPLSQGYLEFGTPQFLQGMITLSSTIGITAPWSALELMVGEGWVPAAVTFP